MTAADFPNLEAGSADMPTQEKLLTSKPSTRRPRILLLYGSLRERSYSRFLTLEAERLLQHFGAETRVFDPRIAPTGCHGGLRIIRILGCFALSPARQENLTASYIIRLLRLTFLAPDILVRVIDGDQPSTPVQAVIGETVSADHGLSHHDARCGRQAQAQA